MSDRRTCKTCISYAKGQAHAAYLEDPLKQGECRLDQPTLFTGIHEETRVPVVISGWPIVSDDTWCSKYVPGPVPKEALNG